MSKTEISRRKLLIGVAGVGAASAVGGAGSYAYLSDQGEAIIEFQSGSIVLKISPETITFDQDDGDEMVESIEVQNIGTLSASQLSLDGVPLSGSNELKVASEVTTLEYRGTDILSNVQSVVPDANGNGIIDLHDLHNHFSSNPYALESQVGGDGLSPGGSETATLTIGVTMDYSQITQNSQTLSASVSLLAQQ